MFCYFIKTKLRNRKETKQKRKIDRGRGPTYLPPAHQPGPARQTPLSSSSSTSLSSMPTKPRPCSCLPALLLAPGDAQKHPAAIPPLSSHPPLLPRRISSPPEHRRAHV